MCLVNEDSWRMNVNRTVARCQQLLTWCNLFHHHHHHHYYHHHHHHHHSILVSNDSRLYKIAVCFVSLLIVTVVEHYTIYLFIEFVIFSVLFKNQGIFTWNSFFLTINLGCWIFVMKFIEWKVFFCTLCVVHIHWHWRYRKW